MGETCTYPEIKMESVCYSVTSGRWPIEQCPEVHLGCAGDCEESTVQYFEGHMWRVVRLVGAIERVPALGVQPDSLRG